MTIIHASLTSDGKVCRIVVHGSFDFTVHWEFLEAYEHIHGVDSFIVDLSEVTRLDSSALGLLLLLRDHAGGGRESVHLVKCPPDVARVLDTHNFNQLFVVSYQDDAC